MCVNIYVCVCMHVCMYEPKGGSAPPSRCHFVTQGLLPTVAVLGAASSCPSVAL